MAGQWIFCVTTETHCDMRSATAADEAAVVALWHECHLVVGTNDPHGDFHFARAKEGSDILVAVNRAGAIRGSIMVGHDGHRGWLYYVCVAETCRMRGIGRLLVRAAESWLAQREVPKAQLMVRDTNPHVVPFYRRIGYDIAPRIILQKWLTKTG